MLFHRCVAWFANTTTCLYNEGVHPKGVNPDVRERASLRARCPDVSSTRRNGRGSRTKMRFQAA
eukprot:569359-Heterocapsa_arctica.AAC.1